MTDFMYKAYISHSSADDREAEWLIKALSAYRLPEPAKVEMQAPARIGAMFSDRDEVPGTDQMTADSLKALRASEFLIVLCSPSAVRSKLVNREIAEFSQVRGSGHILRVIISGAPHATDPANECYPESLKTADAEMGHDANGGLDALTVEPRPEGDGKREAMLRLVAALLGLRVNAVLRHDDVRRYKRMMGLAVAAATGMALMGGMALEAVRARTVAEEAQMLAEIKNREAEQRLADVENLTRFISDTIYEELLAAGSLAVLENVSGKLIEKLEKKDLGPIGVSQMAHIIGAHLRLGQALERHGESEQARLLFNKAVGWARDQHEKIPDDLGTLSAYGIALFFTGYLNYRQGDYDAAERDYTERLRINRLGFEKTLPFSDGRPHPERGTWAEELAHAENGVCSLQFGPFARPQDALATCQISVERRRKFLELAPDDTKRKISLASSYQYIGPVYLALGRIHEARSAFMQRLALYDSILEAAPEDYRILRRQALAWQTIATVDSLEGKTDAALQRLVGAVRSFDILTAQDPENIMWRGDSAAAYRQYGAALLAAGRYDEAATASATATRQITATLRGDNSRVARRLTGHEARLLAAEIARAQSKSADFQRLTAAAVAAFEAEPESYARVPGALDFAGKLYLTQAEAHTQAGDKAGAHAALAKLTALYDRATATKTPIFTQATATAYAQLGDKAKAAALATLFTPEAGGR